MSETVKDTEGLMLTENALTVLRKRYLVRDEEGKALESAADLFRRVARSVAEADRAYGGGDAEVETLASEFYSIMTTLEFLPNSPTLMNAGRPLGQLSACFVLPVEDSMESIFDAVKNAAIIHKSGGGTGFSFTRLRPSGDVVGSTKGVSSGPVSFMTVFDTATEAVKQGGTRRGANMGMLRVDHPDILSFINCKRENSKLNNFNISVAITDDFMRAVEQDGDYGLINPRNGNTDGTLRAREVFKLIVNHAWQNGEPGIVFIDRINECNPTPAVGVIDSTNPCGEQPLLPYESCNLGSINLSRMVAEGGEKRVDWERLRATVRSAVHFLDNVIDVNQYPIDKIAEMTRSNRKIGLGVMGWADMLIELGVPYNSAEAVRLAEEVMGFIQREGHAASHELAAGRGSFPNFERSIYADTTKTRNATVTTIAPTGTLSILAGCSSGIEPLFAVSYVRTVMEGTKLVEVHPVFERIAKERGFYSAELMERIAEEGSLHGFDEVPDDVKRLFVTAHDIRPVEHISMQAAFQRYVDNAVSKTVNFQHEATKQDVEEVYMLAYRMGCKGVTVYRDGSRDEQVLSTGGAGKAAAVAPGGPVASPAGVTPRKRPEAMSGSTRLMTTGCGKLYVTINQDAEGNVFELFTQMGKAGGCAASQSEALGRMISLALRSNISKAEIVTQLKGISCHQPAWGSTGRIHSCADAIAKALEKFVPSGAENQSGEGNGGNGNGGNGGNGQPQDTAAPPAAPVEDDIMIVGACPECGGTVEHEGGCAVCHNCGFTRCG
jgi:ribonucleoside-diphosphate reductase alpha chain